MGIEASAAQPFMTVLEAHVDPAQWPTLRQAYSGAVAELPAQIMRSFLVQSGADPTLWRVESIWRSRAALEEYRRSVTTPGGILIFRAAGAEPVFSSFDVVATVPTSLS